MEKRHNVYCKLHNENVKCIKDGRYKYGFGNKYSK